MMNELFRGVKLIRVAAVLGLAALCCSMFALADAEQSAASYPNVKVNGYIQAQYKADDGGENAFRVMRARGKMSGQASEQVKYSLLFDLIDDKQGSNLADAYLDIGCIPNATIRVGQFKTPFSMEYLISSTKLDTIELAQAVSKLSSKRDVGIQISSKASILSWTLGIFNGTGSNTLEKDKRKNIIGRVVIDPTKKVALGVSHHEGWSEEDEEYVTRRRTGAQFLVNMTPLVVKAEFILGKTDETDGAGGYLQLTYDMPFMHDDQTIQWLGKYETYDPNLDKSEDKTDIVTIGANWFITKATKIQVNNRLILDDDPDATVDEILAQFQAIW